MIQANELRIGNLIRIYNSDFPEMVEIIKVDPSIIMCLTGEIDTKKVRFEPIKLTEEWLVKFGFEFDGSGYKIENDKYIFKLLFHDCWNDCWNISYEEKPGFGGSNCFMELFPMVHDIQNIFRVFSGEELTIKE